MVVALQNSILVFDEQTREILAFVVWKLSTDDPKTSHYHVNH